MVCSMKYDAEKLPLLYAYIEAFGVRSDELGVTMKPSQTMFDWAKVLLAGLMRKVKVMVLHITVYTIVSKRERVTEDAK